MVHLFHTFLSCTILHKKWKVRYTRYTTSHSTKHFGVCVCVCCIVYIKLLHEQVPRNHEVNFKQHAFILDSLKEINEWIKFESWVIYIVSYQTCLISLVREWYSHSHIDSSESFFLSLNVLISMHGEHHVPNPST